MGIFLFCWWFVCLIALLILSAFSPKITKEERERECGNPNCHIHGKGGL